MPERAIHRMTADEFLSWHEGQEQRYELVDGVPVAMAGARRRHDQVVVNALVCIGGQLGVGPCRPFSSDTAVRISAYQIRYPDVGIDCGRFLDEELAADAPALVLEVLSEGTRAFDTLGKLEEYKSVASLRHIVLVDTDEPRIIYWSRAMGEAWSYRTLGGLDATLAIVDPGVAVPLRTLYSGLTFRQKPRLVTEVELPSPH
ncbi:MAG TPA: Uma2 family endonuclease [Acetobacteraceae bacterium]